MRSAPSPSHASALVRSSESASVYRRSATSSSWAASCARACLTSSSADEEARAERAGSSATTRARTAGFAAHGRHAADVFDALRVLDGLGAPGALVDLEDALADAHRVGRHLDELVGVDPLHGRLDVEHARRREQHVLVLAVVADVRELLLLDDVDVGVVRAVVLAHDHALVHLRRPARGRTSRAAEGGAARTASPRRRDRRRWRPSRASSSGRPRAPSRRRSS